MFYVLNMIAALHARVENAKDRGATATEYALLLAFIAIAIVTAVTFFSGQLSGFFNNVGAKVGLTK